jgi:dynein heavy chain 1
MKEAVKQGAWVNVKECPSWIHLGYLNCKRKFMFLLLIQNFRLFLTAEFSPKIPSTLIRQSYKLVFEPADGVKASLLKNL